MNYFTKTKHWWNIETVVTTINIQSIHNFVTFLDNKQHDPNLVAKEQVWVARQSQQTAWSNPGRIAQSEVLLHPAPDKLLVFFWIFILWEAAAMELVAVIRTVIAKTENFIVVITGYVVVLLIMRIRSASVTLLGLLKDYRFFMYLQSCWIDLYFTVRLFLSTDNSFCRKPLFI
jgi:hypothetical protein